MSNPTVRELRSLLSKRAVRHEQRRFVVEGPVATAEAVASGARCVMQFVPEASGSQVDGAGAVHELAAGVFERVAPTTSPRSPLTVVEMPAVADDLLAGAAFVVVLDRIADPGNLGTVLRSAEAAGADAIVLTPGSVDAFNPKVVRSSAGAILHVPVVSATVEEVAAAGLVTFGTSSHESPGRVVTTHVDADLTGRIAIVLGNEAAGLDGAVGGGGGAGDGGGGDGAIGGAGLDPGGGDDTVAASIERWLTIPHRGRSESLNVAMAATVLVFEAARQRDDGR